MVLRSLLGTGLRTSLKSLLHCTPAPLQLDLGSLAAVEEPHAAVVVLQRQAGDAPRRRREAGRRPEEHYAHPWRGKEIGAVFIENDCGLL